MFVLIVCLCDPFELLGTLSPVVIFQPPGRIDMSARQVLFAFCTISTFLQLS